MTVPLWTVWAWVQAPGEFPSPSLERRNVAAADVQTAMRKATTKLEQAFLNPEIVRVQRVSPAYDHGR